MPSVLRNRLDLSNLGKKFVCVGDYRITGSKNRKLKGTHLWVEDTTSGEGMDTPLDDLIRHLEDAIERYFNENM
jgi:hypothetical protein